MSETLKPIENTSSNVGWPLFAGLGMLMLGNGLQASLLSLRAGDVFSGAVAGMVMAGFYVGFFAGSIWTVGAVRRVGHIRVFAALASLASITVLMHGLFIDPALWAGLRFITGVCFAGIFVVAESWLNDGVSNEARGRLLSAYMIVSFAGMGGGQALLIIAEPEEIDLFILVSVLISVSVVPLLLSAVAAPTPSGPQAVALRAVYRASPLGVAGVFVAGVVNGAAFGMGALYAQAIGMNLTGVSAFMGALIAGAAMLQWPLGKLSDLIDRRTVIVLTTFSAAALAIAANAASESGGWLHLGVVMAFGGCALSLHALCLAHTNDHLAPTDMMGASGALVLVLGAGSVTGPLVIGAMFDIVGVNGFFLTLATLLTAFGGYALFRMTRREALPLDEQGAYVAIPATSSSVLIEALEETHAEQTEAESAHTPPGEGADTPEKP